MSENLKEQLKQAILAYLAVHGSGRWEIDPTDIAVRAAAELVHDGLCYESEDSNGWILVITRKGMEAQKS